MNMKKLTPTSWCFIWPEPEGCFISFSEEIIKNYAQRAWSSWGKTCGFVIPLYDHSEGA